MNQSQFFKDSKKHLNMGLGFPVQGVSIAVEDARSKVAGADRRFKYGTSQGLSLGFAIFIVFGMGWIRRDVHAEDMTSVQLQTFPSFSRLIVKSEEGIEFQKKTSKTGLIVLIKNVHSIRSDQKIEDERISNFKVKNTKDGILLTGAWKFPTGMLALAEQKMQVFDFRQYSPSQWVLDFWVKEGLTLVQQENLKAKKELKIKEQEEINVQARKLKEKIEKLEKNKKGIDGIRDFCHRELSRDKDLFLEFYPDHSVPKTEKVISDIAADENYHYNLPRKKLHQNQKEIEYVRLAIELYQRNQIALSLKTLDFLANEFPNFQMSTELRFLKSNAFFKLGFLGQSEILFNQVISANYKTIEAFYSALFLAENSFNKKQHLIALEKYTWLIKHYPQHRLIHFFHYRVADCLYALKDLDNATFEYRWIMENASDRTMRGSAALRIGDLYYLNSKYEQSLMSYSEANDYFGDIVQKTPSYYLNIGESLFQIGQLDRAKTVLTEFLEKYSNYPEGWRATLRLGEIESHQKWLSFPSAVRWFYMTINEYPTSLGATIARMRLLPCGDHAGLNNQAQRQFFKFEEDNIGKNKEKLSVIHGDQYLDFIRLSKIRTLMSMGSDFDVAKTASSDYLLAKSSILRKILSTIAHEAIADSIDILLNDQKKVIALNQYNEIEKILPPLIVQLDQSYLLKLSQIASEFGFENRAKNIFSKFLKNKKNLELDQNIELKNKIKYNKNEEVFTSAFLSFKEIYNNKSNDQLKLSALKKIFMQIDDNLNYGYEKNIMLALLEMKDSNLDLAIHYAIKADFLKSNSKLSNWIASMMDKKNELDFSMNYYEKAKSQFKNEVSEDAVSDLLPSLPNLKFIQLNQALIYEKKGQWLRASSVYEEILKNEEDNQILYQYGNSLMKQTNETQSAKGISVLKKLLSKNNLNKNDQIWKKLAFEKINAIPGRGINE